MIVGNIGFSAPKRKIFNIMAFRQASLLCTIMQSYFNPHIIAKYDIVCLKVMKLFAWVKNENNNIPTKEAWDLFKAYFTKFTMKFESFGKYQNLFCYFNC